MKDLHSRIGDLSKTWLVARHYNEIRLQIEREGSGIYKEEGPMAFNDKIEKSHINELPSIGGNFT